MSSGLADVTKLKRESHKNVPDDCYGGGMTNRRVRTLFISDTHLGARGCQAESLLDFLRFYEADTIYLVGDIIDGWRLRASWRWPQAHNDVVQKLLRKVRKGARIVYLPGNHDEFMRQYVGSQFGGIEIAEEAIHETADGRRLLVLHGDKFDAIVRRARWLARLGDWAYNFAMILSRHISTVREWMGLPYWSFSQWSKHNVKRAVNFISAFEQAVTADAARQDVDGVVCGHIHKPTVQLLDGFLYINTGDWVESCSAVIEHSDGALELLNWRVAEQAIEPAAVEQEWQPAA